MASLKSLQQIKSEGGEFIGQWHDGWQLYAYPVNAAGWRKLHVRRQAIKQRGQVRSAILSWNGSRLAAEQERDGIPRALREWVAAQMSGFEAKHQGQGAA